MNDDSPLEQSYAACAGIVGRAKSSFPFAFRFLPDDQRAGMNALYAWLRIADDLADDPGEDAANRLRLWGDLLRREDAPGLVEHRRILPAVRDTIDRFRIPLKHFDDVLAGVQSDFEPRIFESFDALYPYCYRVASAVGLACLCIWGADFAAAQAPAEAAGIAFQLTNILRDVGEDQNRGRIYLPREDWLRFGCEPEAWHRQPERFRRLVLFEAARARRFYAAAEALPPLLPPPARKVFHAMTAAYRELLGEIERHPGAVLTRRLRVNKAKKLWLFLKAAIIK